MKIDFRTLFDKKAQKNKRLHSTELTEVTGA